MSRLCTNCDENLKLPGQEICDTCHRLKHAAPIFPITTIHRLLRECDTVQENDMQPCSQNVLWNVSSYQVGKQYKREMGTIVRETIVPTHLLK